MGAPVMVLCETSGDRIRTASLPAVTAAQRLAEHHGGGVVAVVIGAGMAAAAKDVARYVAKVMVFDAPALAAPLSETHAAMLAAAVKAAGAGALVATATSTGKDVIPRAATLLDAGFAGDVMAVAGAKKFRRPTHAGSALCDVEVLSPVVALTVRQTEFPAAAPAAAAGTIEAGATGAGSGIDALGSEVVALHSTVSSRPDLGEARVVVAGGRGMKEAKNFKILEELTDLLGGAMGASRAATDAGMVPADWQVGQTGKVVAPQLYIAVAISGAIQHLAGMKGSKVIVAINKDPEAPIFQVADYGFVTTWEAAVPALIAEIRKLKASG